MTLEEFRNRLAEIENRMEEIAGEDFQMNDEEAKEYDELTTEHKEVRKKIERITALDGVRDYNSQSQTEPTKPPVDGDGKSKMPDGMAADGEFKNLGDFLHHARFVPDDSRIKELREASMSQGSTGGILVPEQFSQQILMIDPETAIVRPRATVIPAGSSPDASFSIPALRQGSKGVYSGVTFTATAEGQEMTEIDGPTLEDIGLEPAEQSGYITVTNKLLNNSEAASALLTSQLRKGKIGYEDHLFLSQGNGVNKPLAVLNTSGAMVIDRDTSASIKFEDVVAMKAAMLPSAMNGAIFIASQSAYGDIKDLKDTSSNRIYTGQNIVKGTPAMLDGTQIIFTGRTSTLGNKGDLMLVNFEYYLVKDGSGLYIAASEHVKFTSNKTVIKIVFNIDGQSWVKEPLTLEDGSTKVSPIVILK
jgi:HK97 family phage major capsid protein